MPEDTANYAYLDDGKPQPESVTVSSGGPWQAFPLEAECLECRGSGGLLVWVVDKRDASGAMPYDWRLAGEPCPHCRDGVTGVWR